MLVITGKLLIITKCFGGVCVCVWRVEGKVAFDVLKIVFLHPFFYNQEIQYK